jgi:hypothetical protein
MPDPIFDIFEQLEGKGTPVPEHVKIQLDPAQTTEEKLDTLRRLRRLMLQISLELSRSERSELVLAVEDFWETSERERFVVEAERYLSRPSVGRLFNRVWGEEQPLAEFQNGLGRDTNDAMGKFLFTELTQREKEAV